VAPKKENPQEPPSKPAAEPAAEPDPFGEDPPRPAAVLTPAVPLRPALPAVAPAAPKRAERAAPDAPAEAVAIPAEDADVAAVRLQLALPAAVIGHAVELDFAEVFIAEVRELRSPLGKLAEGPSVDFEVVTVEGQFLALPAVAAGGAVDVVAGEGLANENLDAEAMQMQAFEQQFQGQFRGILKSELFFVRKVSQPDEQQFKPVVAKANDALKQATKKFAEVQRKMMQGGFRAGEDMSYPDPRKIISEALLQAVREHLREDQAERYEQEIARRAEYRRHVAVQNLLFRLDNRLVLDDDQRAKIGEGLARNFQESWANQLEYMLYDHFQSNIPDEVVVPFLNANQKSVWELSKSNMQTFWGWGGFGIQVAENLWDLPADDMRLIDAVPAEVEVFAAPTIIVREVENAEPVQPEPAEQPAKGEPSKDASEQQP
jgi:hypothetical protein